MQYVRLIHQILGKSLKKVIVYGSYARGDYRENSDIDVMILCTLSDQEIETTEGKMFDLAFDLELEYGVVINPILKNEEHFRYWLGALPFYDNVQKEGLAIGW